MGILDFLKKKAAVTVEPRNSTQPIERLTEDGELPFGWYARHEHNFQPYEAQIVQMATDLKQMKGSNRIAQIEKIVALYEEYKQFCYKNGECYIKYFSDMWEHCHNSRCEDFEYIAPFLAELEALKNNNS